MLYAVSLALGEHSSYGDIIQKWKKIFFMESAKINYSDNFYKHKAHSDNSIFFLW